MAVLAAKDYDGRIREIEGPVVLGYTDVVIEVKPHLPAETVFTKFAILGLYYGVTAMARDNTWKVAVFGMLWEGKHVGWIWFRKPGSNSENQSELQHLQDQMQNLTGEALSEALIDLNNTSATIVPENLTHKRNPNNSNVNTSTTNASNSDFELFMSYYPHGTPLYPAQVFLAVMSTLQEMAKYDVNDDVIPFRVRIPGFRSNIQWDYPEGDKLNGPPSFEYKWVIEAARQLPRWMLERKFAESFFTIAVNGYVIGRGDIYSGRVPGLGTEDVATS